MIIGPDDARRVLLATVGPTAVPALEGDPAQRCTGLVAHLRHVQIDPIDRIGTNHDLVAMARVDGLSRGDVHRAHGFEHFAKERCLLPASAWPHYRDQAHRTPTWRHTKRMRELDPGLLDAVEAEVRDRGPVTPASLGDHGRVVPTDWSGWKGTGKAGTLALSALATRCRLVVTGRSKGQRVYDTPERALPEVATRAASGPFAPWALRERVAAAGLLARATGPWWSMLKEARADGTVDALVEEGTLVEVQIAGSTRTWLTSPDALARPVPPDDERLRILGPLDPVLWNRSLLQIAFSFEYVWEVYKPAERRRWGYYVTPLLFRGRLVGRAELSVQAGATGTELVVDRVWREDGALDFRDAFVAAVTRHAEQLGCSGVSGLQRADRPEGAA
jgi:uncharacterized protein YcaQ